MKTETFHIRITEATRGRSYCPRILEEYSFESSNVFKDVALKISECNMFQYPCGIYFVVRNQNGEAEKFWAKNNGDGTTYTRYCTSNHEAFGTDYTDWDAKPKYLTCLDEETNEYKYYLMTFDKDKMDFNVQYGRIGMKAGEFVYADGNYSKDGTYSYPAPMFWIKYYEKIAKGYEDKTILKDFDKQGIIKKQEAKYEQIEEEKTRNIIEHLISRQREYVQKSFDLSVPFSEKAVQISKELLNEMKRLSLSKTDADTENAFKDLYKELVTTLPRKIYNVSEYINRIDFKTVESENYIQNILEEEQELLDNFCDLYDTQKEISNKEAKTEGTVLDANNMEACVPDFKDKFLYLEKMEDDAYKVSHIINVTNNRTKTAYEQYKAEKGIENRGCHLLWHGSRTENWWSIAKNGMSLNPNAVITGKMFGQGLYFAPKAQKSMGYTDMQGSYWAKGSSKLGYLALFEVAMGKPYEPTHSLPASFKEKNLQNGCHSVWAYPSKTGLRNEECIVYDERQANMVALVEIDSSRNQPFRFDLKKAGKLRINTVKYCDEGSPEILAKFSNFTKNCPSLSKEQVNLSYSIENKRLSIYNTKGEIVLSEAERDYLTDVFMSQFCDNERDFFAIADEIKKLKAVPKTIQAKIKKSNGKDKENEYTTA